VFTNASYNFFNYIIHCSK